jgi:hypothetical protein
VDGVAKIHRKKLPIPRANSEDLAEQFGGGNFRGESYTLLNPPIKGRDDVDGNPLKTLNHR